LIARQPNIYKVSGMGQINTYFPSTLLIEGRRPEASKRAERGAVLAHGLASRPRAARELHPRITTIRCQELADRDG